MLLYKQQPVHLTGGIFCPLQINMASLHIMQIQLNKIEPFYQEICSLPTMILYFSQNEHKLYNGNISQMFQKLDHLIEILAYGTGSTG